MLAAMDIIEFNLESDTHRCPRALGSSGKCESTFPRDKWPLLWERLVLKFQGLLNVMDGRRSPSDRSIHRPSCVNKSIGSPAPSVPREGGDRPSFLILSVGKCVQG
jgi:hypothetical protein